jgi:hypothetical protein
MPELQTTTTGLFSGKTLTELEDGVLSKLGEPAQTFTRYTQAEIRAYLNQGLRIFCQKTRLLKSQAIAQIKAGTRYYKLPTNFYDFVHDRWPARYRAADGSGYTRLERTSVQRLDNVSGTWRDQTGSPRGIMLGLVFGNTRLFGLVPIPDADGEAYTGASDPGVVIAGTNFSIGNNVNGNHKAGFENSAFYVDADGRDLAALGVVAGMVIENLTDGSRGSITAVGNQDATNDKISVTLAGGAGNDFDSGDSVVIYAGEYGVVTSWESDTEKYIFNTETGVLANITTPNGNVEFEYVREAAKLANAGQYPEIPSIFHDGLEWFAAGMLLGTEHDGRIDKTLASSYLALWADTLASGSQMNGDNLGFPEAIEMDPDYIGEL